MSSSLRVVSKAGTLGKKLSFDARDGISAGNDPHFHERLPHAESRIAKASIRKPLLFLDDSESSFKVSTSGGMKKTTTLPCSSQGQRQQHHRRSPSLNNFPRFENAVTDSAALSTRALRQSASFSGRVFTSRGGRLADQSTPCSSRKTSRNDVNGAAWRISPRLELEEDPAFLQDHNVQVLLRARPISGIEIAQLGHARCIRQENAYAISWLGQPETRFSFDYVASEFVTQEELFRVAGPPMVENCMAGNNSCVFAYGQTGSGKTHTMLGDVGDFDRQPNENRGMTPRVFEYLFKKIHEEEVAQRHTNMKFKCRCSFLEIYNEQISDLLEPSSSNLPIREDSTKGIYVDGLVEVEAQNVRNILHLLLLGAANRKVAATDMNRESSRSHSVFTCVIESQWECDATINSRIGRLNLVDLAGSERQKSSGVDGERFREAASINKSLSTLGLVIMDLVDIANGKQRHVPYRDSKLTFLLQDSLGGNSKTTIIANISPSSCASSETLSTLKFAQRAKFIQNNAVVGEDASREAKGSKEHIQQLKGWVVEFLTEFSFRILKQDELARLRRQNNSAIPTVRLSELNDDLSTDLNSFEGSFLQFGRAVLSPIALLHKPEMLVVKLVSERQVTKRLRNEVGSYQRELSECRMKLRTSLDANQRIVSELDVLRIELESSQDECKKLQQDLGTMKLEKALEVNCLELKQAQHHELMFELKAQLLKSEEKAEQEASSRSQLEIQLQEATQESTNLQTELQWTRDSLEEVESLVERLQRKTPALESGVPEASYENFMVGQLQAEIIEMHARLEDEHKRRCELEVQMANYVKYQEIERKINRECVLSTDDSKATRKKTVRHHDAILQLQLELDTIDGESDAIKSFRWEEGTHDDEAEVKNSVTIMQLQLKVETLEAALLEERQCLAEVRATNEQLRQQLENPQTELHGEKARIESFKGGHRSLDVESKSTSEDGKARMHTSWSQFCLFTKI
nr:kinesin-like protein KIN-12E isoform X4 [Physcomitrium patens]|eukprot:XP_024401386.1 kinesin-like protein KIN-12E isoform X4 [Physcomitrella patens]